MANTNNFRAATAKKVQARLRPAPQQVVSNRRVVRREPHVPILREYFAAFQDLAAELAEHHMQRCQETRDDIYSDPSEGEGEGCEKEVGQTR